jgi:hypothetical protein
MPMLFWLPAIILSEIWSLTWRPSAARERSAADLHLDSDDSN